jgi:cytidylate kinase
MANSKNRKSVHIGNDIHEKIDSVLLPGESIAGFVDAATRAEVARRTEDPSRRGVEECLSQIKNAMRSLDSIFNGR